MILTKLTHHRDVGLLILRVGVGLMFMGHGIPKLLGGPDTWRMLGQGVGVPFLPTFFGLMAGIGESLGGLLLVLGLLFRPGCILLSLVMLGAITYHFRAGDAFALYSRPIEMLILFVSLLLIGPGRYSLDHRLAGGEDLPPSAR
jgi:putative oxidoreductase